MIFLPLGKLAFMKSLMLSAFTLMLVQVNAQIVSIPDVAFKSILVGNPAININGDGEIQTSEAAAFSDSIYAYNAGVSSLQGIEAFTNLSFLSVSSNTISSVDLSQNSQLKSFIAPFNNLSTIDVSGNPLLQQLEVSSNFLTSIDVTQNPLLRRLELAYNTITALDLSQNPLLEELNISNNVIGSLDLSQNPLLEEMYLSNNVIGSLDLSIHSNLSELEADGCGLTSLDLSNNPLLSVLYLMANDISQLDFSQNVMLTSMRCDYNEVETLDLSMCPTLNRFGCFSCTNLTYVNLKNGNSPSIANFQASNSPNIECISVDDVAYAVANWTSIDNSAVFALFCDASLDEAFLAEVDCYPNPMTDELLREADSPIERVEVHSADGSLILQHQPNALGAKLDVEDLTEGVYLVRVTLENGAQVVKRVAK